VRYFKELDKESRVMYRISIDHVERNKILAMLVDKVFCEDFSSFPTRCKHLTWRYEDRGNIIELEFGVAPSASPELIDRPLYFVLIVSEKLAEPWFSDSELERRIEIEGVKNVALKLSNSLRQIAVLSLERLKSDSISSFSQKLFSSGEDSIHGIYVRIDVRRRIVYRIMTSRHEEKAEIWVYDDSGKSETPFVHALIRLSPNLHLLEKCAPREAVDIIVQAVIDELNSLSSMTR
jgi:hypothetical protein